MRLRYIVRIGSETVGIVHNGTSCVIGCKPITMMEIENILRKHVFNGAGRMLPTPKPSGHNTIVYRYGVSRSRYLDLIRALIDDGYQVSQVYKMPGRIMA